MKKIFITFLFFAAFLYTPAFCLDDKEDGLKYMNLPFFENFSDDVLISNLLMVYENNFDLKNAALKIKENEQVVSAQFAQELPFMSLDGNLNRTLQGAREEFGNMQIPKYSQYSYNIPITAGYEIDIWGKNRFLTKSKKEQLEIVKEMERATYISLTSDFATDYFNLIAADEMIKIQDEIIKIQKDILSKTREKYKAGLCTKFEVLDEEKILSGLIEEYNLHLQTRDVLLNTLKVYLADVDNDVQRNNFKNLVLLEKIPDKISTDVLLNRPDYKMEEANLKRIGFDIKAAKREFLPTFTIFGQVGLNAYHLGSLFNKPSQFFSAGVLPSVDLFSGGRKRAVLRMKKYEYEEALNNYQKTFIVGVKDLNSGLVEHKIALKNLNEAKEKLKNEEKIYTLAKDKEKIGASSTLDTLYAKENYLLLQKEFVLSKINSIVASIGLYKAAGSVDLCKIEEL